MTALFDLYRTHFEKLVRYTTKFTKDESLAEEIVQGAFLKIMESGKFDSNRGPVAYLQKCCLNYYRNYLRKASKLDPLSDKEAELSTTIDFEGRIFNQEVRERVQKLPFKQRQAVNLFLDGYVFREIANEQESPYDTAKANFRHGVMKLRDSFKD